MASIEPLEPLKRIHLIGSKVSRARARGATKTFFVERDTLVRRALALQCTAQALRLHLEILLEACFVAGYLAHVWALQFICDLVRWGSRSDL
jgi:hypothetical protein